MNVKQYIDIVFVLVLLYGLTHVTQGFEISNVLKIEDFSESTLSCYNDGFMALKEYLTFTGTIKLIGNSPPVVHVYRKSNIDSSRFLLCIMDLSRYNASWPCSFTQKKSGEYAMNIKLQVTEDFNQTHIIVMPQVQDASYHLLSDLIKVHPYPNFMATLNGNQMDLKQCYVHLNKGSNFTIEFCADNLKEPSLEVSWAKLPKPLVRGRCVMGSFHLAISTDKIVMAYKDECGDVGSFTCVIGEEDFVTDIPGQPHPHHHKQPPPNDQQMTDWSILLITAMCVAVISLAVCLISFIYGKCKPCKLCRRRRRRKLFSDTVLPSHMLSDLGRRKSSQKVSRVTSSHHSIHQKPSSSTVRRTKSGTSFYFAS